MMKKKNIMKVLFFFFSIPHIQTGASCYNTQELDLELVKPDAPRQYAVFDSNRERK